jgi:hypothetical protein
VPSSIFDVDQISTIIHRLEQLVELLNPVTLAEAIQQAIIEVGDPLPGNVDGLRALAEACAKAADVASGQVAGDLQAMAWLNLPDVWLGDGEVTASGAVSDTSELVGLAGPALSAAASAIDAYASTLSELDKRRSSLLQQLREVAGSGPDLDLFGLDIPLDPLRLAGWVASAVEVAYDLIHVYNALQDAADTLAGQLADAASGATAGAALGAGMNATEALVLAVAGTVGGVSLLGTAQLTRFAQLMKTMSAADRGRLEAALRAAKSPAQQAYIAMALAAGHSVSQVVAFAGEIRGKSDAWLTSHLSLASSGTTLSYGNTALEQMTETECGSASIVAARALTDPIFAYSLTTGANGKDLTGAQFLTRAAVLEAQTHDATNRFWPQILGTSPWGVASGMNSATGGGAGYGVQWVDDTDARSASAALEQAISAVDAGHPVPVLLAPTLGNLAHGAALHYVLITGHSNGQLSIYDPEGGAISDVPDSDFLNGNMQTIDAAAPHVNAVIVPGG